MQQRAVGFVFEIVSRTTRSRPSGIAALNHEVGNYSVKSQSIVVTAGPNSKLAAVTGTLEA